MINTPMIQARPMIIQAGPDTLGAAEGKGYRGERKRGGCRAGDYKVVGRVAYDEWAGMNRAGWSRNGRLHSRCVSS